MKKYFHSTSLFVVLVLFCKYCTGQLTSIKITKNSKTIEIWNGVAGIVLPSETALKQGKNWMAPIQSFIYIDGTKSDCTLNFLTAPTPPISAKIDWITKRPSEITLKIEYKFKKEKFVYGKNEYAGGDAGDGRYIFLVTIKLNEKTILIEEDTDYDVSYTVKISNGLKPNKARYRGWSSSSVKYGYEPSGAQYRPENERGYPLDATVDLDYSKTFEYPRLVLWEPAGGEQNSGRYWQVFNSGAGKESNLFGFFQGKPKRLIGGIFSGVQLLISPENNLINEKKKAELKVSAYRRGPDNSWHPRKRFQWGAFISTKIDLKSENEQQPIANELNRISGLADLIGSYSEKPIKIVPAFYKGAIYMHESSVKSLCKRIKKDAELYKMLCEVDVAYKQIWDAWRFPDSAASIKQSLILNFESTKQNYLNGDGSYSDRNRYWKGSNAFKNYALVISALFADEEINISTSERKKLEQFVAMMGRIVWDDNNVPLFENAGVNLGPANMRFMYQNNGRVFFSLLFSKDPEFSERAKKSVQTIDKDINEAIFENGASFATPHYTQAVIEPILFSMLQIKQAGLKNLFKTNSRIEAFAKFYTSFLTPPSVRFMNYRKLISFGDGSEEGAATFGLLAAGLKDINPQLSRCLLSLTLTTPMRGTIFGPLALTLDFEEHSTICNAISNCNYKGYLTHFRAGLNTLNETALWILNGDSLYDHRNDDAGEIAIYALKAPLSLSSSSFYYPSASDSRIKSVVVPESNFPEWNKSKQPISERSLTNRIWSSSNIINFANLGQSASATIRMAMKSGKAWYKKINFITIFEELPIIVLYDSITGNEKNIWSMTMMSESKIETPMGLISPEKSIYDNIKLKQLPKSTEEFQLIRGLNEFTFTGQKWKAHASGGINWKLYTILESSSSFTLSSWTTAWQNLTEKNEFYKTNDYTYSEEQQIIRLKSHTPFFNIIFPYAKGTNPYSEPPVIISDNSLQIKQKDFDIVINPAFYCAKNNDKFYAAVLSETAQFNKWNVSISGGYTEVEYDADSLTVRMHGNHGNRIINIPFKLKKEVIPPSVFINETRNGTILTLKYVSSSIDLPNGEKGLTEFSFVRE
ncbi:MAG: hypothetical protein ACTHLE_11005 [Agriterribacter sp.]